MADTYLFVLGKSQLGLENKDARDKIGVAEGGEAIMAVVPDSLKTKSSQLTLNFPEKTNAFFTIYKDAVAQLLEKWGEQRLAFFGGDHSSSFISLSAVIQKFGAKNTAVVMFDSHADLNLPHTSPSGNFHGMWLRGFLDVFGEAEHYFPSQKLGTQQLRYVGNLVLDPAEAELIDSRHIINHSGKNISPQASQELLNWARSYSHLHISFDVDIFAQSLVAATGTPNPDGLTESQVFMMLEPLLKHPSISFDIVEYNPEKTGAKKSFEVVKKVLAAFLK